MFNKYRGQPQIKNMNRSSEKDAFIRKPQARPAVEDVIDDPSIRSAIDDGVAEPARQLEADYEASRQQEEDEWFRRFKGEPEPNEEPASEQIDLNEEVESTEVMVQGPEQSERIDEPSQDDLKEGSSEAPEQSDDTTIEYPEIEESETAEEESEELAEAVEEMTDEAPREKELVEEFQLENAPVSEENSENLDTVEISVDLDMAEEEQNVTTEKDDEKWIQDLLSDIQEKTGSATEESSKEEISLPPVVANLDSKEPLEVGDESGWYQSTPLIRTAALIVLDLTEPDDEEGYVEETPADVETYQTDTESTEEEVISDLEEQLLEPIDEEVVEKAEDELEEITIDDVDEKLATLMEGEPKSDLDMDEMLDNMDRIIQQTEPTPVKFVEEPISAPALRPRVNQNRNRKNKKKKKR